MLNRTVISRGGLLLAIGKALLLGLLLTGAGCASARQAPGRDLAPGTREYVQAALAYQEGDRQRALAALDSALQRNPNLIMARFLLGNIYRDEGNYEAAALQYERVVQLDPYSYINHFNLGLMYHLLNRLQEAMASYLQALKLNPQDLKSNMYLGLVYAALGRPELGLPYSRKAVEIDPKSADAQGNLAVVCDAAGDYTSAEQAYRRAIELAPARVENIINLAGNLVSQKRFREAISVYEQVLATRNSSLLRQRYGYALLQAGQLDAALQQFNEALKLNPQNYQALNGIGDVLLAQYRQSAMLDESKRLQAVECWRRSLQLNSRQPRVAALIKEYTDSALFP